MKRGRILRDTNSGPGIVSVDGTQKSFSLEQHWRSATPPKVGGFERPVTFSIGLADLRDMTDSALDGP